VQFPYLVECIDFNLLQAEIRLRGVHRGVQPIAVVGTPGAYNPLRRFTKCLNLAAVQRVLVVAQFGLSYCGVVLSVAVYQAKRRLALSEVEGISRYSGIERQPNRACDG
jgi:hypothetical protein